MKQDMIVILDLGSTENTAVARQIRELGVYSEIHPHDITPQALKELENVKGIVLNGGESSVMHMALALIVGGITLFVFSVQARRLVGCSRRRGE